MSATTISLFIDIFVVFFVILGIIWGIIRGFKKSSVRIAFIIPSIIIAMLISYSLTGALLNIRLPFLENNQTINEFISSMVTNSVPMNFSLDAVTGTMNIVLALAKMAIATILFIIVFFLFKMITWIVYAIITKRKGSKKTEDEQESDGKDAKKHRLLGGLVGALQGLLVATVFLVPVAGFSGIVADLNKTANADTGSTSIIQEYVPSDIIPYLDVYENSYFHKIVGWTNLDRGMFQAITTQNVDGIKVSLSAEINGVNNLYRKAQKYEIMELLKDGESEEILNSLSDDDAESLINDVFDWVKTSAIAKFVLVDASNYASTTLDVEQKLTAKSINWNNETTIMKNSFTNILLPTKKVAIEMINGNDDFNSIDLESIDFAMVGRGINGIKQMQLVGKLFEPAIDFSIEKFGFYEMTDKLGVNLRNINIASADWEIELKAIGKGLVLAQKLNNISDMNELSDQDLAELFDILAESEMAEEFNQLIKEYIENETGLILSDEFDIITNDIIRDGIVQAGPEIIGLGDGDNIEPEQASIILSSISSFEELDDAVKEDIVAIIAQATNAETNETDANDMISTAGLINNFIMATDTDEELVDKTQAMVVALEGDPNLIKIYSLRNNKYVVSSYKMSVLQNETENPDIIAMFIVL